MSRKVMVLGDMDNRGLARAGGEGAAPGVQWLPVPAALFRWGDWELLEANDLLAELAGGDVRFSWLFPSSQERRRFLELLQNGGRSGDFHVELSLADGRRRAAVISARRLEEADVVAAVFTDLGPAGSDGLDVENAGECFRELMDCSSRVLYRFNFKKNRHDYVSPSIKDVLGVDPELWRDMGSEAVLAAFHPEDAQRMRSYWSSLEQDGRRRYFCGEVEYRIRDGRGRYRWMRDAHTILWDEQGRFEALLGSAVEVTERRETRRDLAESNYFLHSIIEGLPAPFFQKDLQGRYALVNQAFEEFVGWSKAEILGRSVDEIMASEFSDLCRAMDLELLKAEGPATQLYEHAIPRADGQIRHVVFHKAACFDMEGNPSGLVGTIQDITRRKRAEEALSRHAEDLLEAKNAQEENAARLAQAVVELEQARREADEANQAKSDFLANMSHEIRTPMNAILGMAELLLGDEMASGQRRSVEVIKTSADHLLSVINDILDFSRIEAGKLVIESEPLKLSRTLAAALEPLSFTARAKGLDVRWDVDAPEWVSGDAVRIRQILFNLVGNAVKFTQEGGVDVSVRTLVRDEDRGRAVLEFAVADTGPGIPPEKLASMFERFTQLSGTTRKHGGSGLGLSICKRLAELMGGDLTAESEVGRGSVFSFTVDVGEIAEEEVRVLEQQLEEEASRKEAGEARSLRVLVGEDHPMNQVVIQETLSKAGHESVVAENGREVLDRLESEAFDVVLMDGLMPVMDGEEAARRIRSHAEDRVAGTPIIALTALAQETDRGRFLDAGMDDFVTKPVNKWKLLSTIKAVTARREPVEAVAEAAPAPGKAAGFLDLERCSEYVPEDPELRGRLFAMFLEEAPPLGEAVESLVSRGDLVAAGQSAHKLKGICFTVGAFSLAEQASTVHQACSRGDRESAEAALPEFKRILSGSVLEVRDRARER